MPPENGSVLETGEGNGLAPPRRRHPDRAGLAGPTFPVLARWVQASVCSRSTL